MAATNLSIPLATSACDDYEVQFAGFDGATPLTLLSYDPFLTLKIVHHHCA
jgi:hypothetical protein